MTADKKPRKRRTEADKLQAMAEGIERTKAKLYAQQQKYEAALRAAHERAKAAAAALPPLEG